MSWTISKKLAALSVTAVAFVVAVWFVGHRSTTQLGAAAHRMQSALTAGQFSNMADMAHDALRGDVVLAATGDAAQAKDLLENATNHVDDLRTALASVKSTHIGSTVDAAVDALADDITLYTESGVALTKAAAGGDRPTSVQLADFNTVFKRLEVNIPTVADAIDAITQRAEADTAGTRRSGEIGMAALAGLAVAILAGSTVSPKATWARGSSTPPTTRSGRWPVP